MIFSCTGHSSRNSVISFAVVHLCVAYTQACSGLGEKTVLITSATG